MVLIKKYVQKDDKRFTNFYLELDNGVKVAIKCKFNNKLDFVRLLDNAKEVK